MHLDALAAVVFAAAFCAGNFVKGFLCVFVVLCANTVAEVQSTATESNFLMVIVCWFYVYKWFCFVILFQKLVYLQFKNRATPKTDFVRKCCTCNC
jgi:uncharacterized membrane protein